MRSGYPILCQATHSLDADVHDLSGYVSAAMLICERRECVGTSVIWDMRAGVLSWPECLPGRSRLLHQLILMPYWALGPYCTPT